MFGITKDAISMIKSHVESFHKRYLPFGITNDEAISLLKEGHEEMKPTISKHAADSAQTKTGYRFKNTTSTLQSLLDKLLGEDIEEEEYRMKEKKKAQPIT